MRRLKPLIGVLVAVTVPLGALCAATPAMASNVSAIYRQCEQNGAITGHFSRAELQAALNDLPSEVSEYSTCQDLIQQALLRTSSPNGGHQNNAKAHIAGTNGDKGGKGGGSGAGTGSGPGGQAGTGAGAGTAGPGSDSAVTLAGSTIRPGSASTGGASSTLPLALVVVLILLALTAVSGGAVAIRRRVVARHST